MLWYKNWIETRWRIAFSVGMYALMMFSAYKNAGKTLFDTFSLLWIITAVFAAGTGIKTQSANLAAMKGLHGSTYFTLSLPVSPATLFGARTLFGLTQMAVIIVIANCSLWALFPFLKTSSTLGYAAMNGITIFACCVCFYFLSALLAVFLDAQYQMYGTFLLTGICWWPIRDVESGFNFFRALGPAAPLVTHTIPWLAVATSITVGAILYFAILRIIQTREF